VHGILRRSGAFIVVDSVPGRGSRFQLLFPIVAATQDAPDAKMDVPMIPAGSGQTVWVVDDEPAMVRYLGELLAEWGYHVRQFYEPAEVLAALDDGSQEPELLITDQTMPGLSGLQLAQRVRSVRPALPVVLCTGVSEAIDAEEARRLGIRHIFRKPLPVRELVLALAEELAGRPG
jgi:DNA-binding NtrC family response regulator